MLRITALLVCLYVLIFNRLANLQYLDAGESSQLQQTLRTRPHYRRGSEGFERGYRGNIVDSRGNLLAASYDTFVLHVDTMPKHGHLGWNKDHVGRVLSLRDRAAWLAYLLNDLGIPFDFDELMKRVTTTHRLVHDKKTDTVRTRWNRGVILLKGLMPAERDHIEEMARIDHIRNFYFEHEGQRSYPYGALTSQVVGFVADNMRDKEAVKRGYSRVSGAGGIELSMDGQLAAIRGKFHCRRDARGKEMDLAGTWDPAPRDGATVKLTLDVRVQRIADRAIRELAEEFPCESVTALVIETQTGRVLAMQSTPSSTLEDILTERDTETRRKRMVELRCGAVADTLEPGSTIKPLVVAKALEWNLVKWSDSFDTNHGARVFKYGRYKRLLHDSHPIHEPLLLQDVLVKSSNIAMAMIGFERMGIEKLLAALDSYEIRQRPNLLFPGQEPGRYASMEQVRKDPRVRAIDCGVDISFGHSINISPLKLASLYGIFGTGGLYHEPIIIDGLVDSQGEITLNERATKRLIPANIAADIRDTLGQVVERGTAKTCMKDVEWTVGAKTGTAEEIDKRGKTGRFNSSLVANAPLRNSKITVYVGIQGVTGESIYGGQTAGKACAKIIQETLALYKVPKDRVR